MRTSLITPLYLAVVARTAFLATAGDAAKTDKEVIQGTWVPVAAVVHGKERSLEDLKMTYAYRGRQADRRDRRPRSARQGQGRVGTYKLDETKNPKWFDMHPAAELHTPDARGVYELSGDTLRLCLVYGDDPRPTDFKPADDNYVLTYKRVKPPAGESVLVQPEMESEWACRSHSEHRMIASRGVAARRSAIMRSACRIGKHFS